MAECLFLKNTYLFECSAEIIGQGMDDRGTYLLLDRTVFYPQGGGQATDVGSIKVGDRELRVTSVRKDGDEIRHYLADACADYLKNFECLCLVDKNTRILNARYHTAGHLLSNVAEELCRELVAIKAHCFPGEAHVEFQGTGVCGSDALAESMQNAVNADLRIFTFEMDGENFEKKFYKLPYQMPKQEQFRIVQIENYKPIPCGGTHLNSTGEVKNFEITRIKNKNGSLRISFSVT
jgi:alanyl-tRNA synthetase